jgi:hypothetical protein
MSPKIRQVLSVLLVLSLIAAACYGAYGVLRSVIQTLAALNSNIAVAIIAAAGTVLVSVLSVVLGKVYESRQLIQKEHREKKTPVYEDLIKFVSQVLMGEKTGDVLSEKEMAKFMAEFNQRIMVWGSDEVMVALVKWRRVMIDEKALETSPVKAMFSYEELIFAIRRDLGHRNKKLARGDVLAVFVNDIDKHLPRKAG